MKKFLITFKGQQYELEVEELTANSGTANRSAAAAPPRASAAPAPAAAPAVPKASPKVAVPTGTDTVNAPMPGKILAVNFKPGDAVKRGDTVMILEAMKMENEIVAPRDAKISEVCAAAGATVSTGDVLFVLG